MTSPAAKSLGLALVLALPGAALAQTSLHVLHVESLGMRADRTRVHVGEPFHLAIHVRVREDVAALDELQIPDVGTMQVLGDERRTIHSAAGTDVVETLTLEPSARGRFTFAPAYLDAIDGRDGKPKRFSADHPVTVVVDLPGPLGADPGRLLRRLAGGLLVALGLGLALVLLVLLGRMRRRREPPAVPAPQPVAVAPPAPPRSPRDEVAAALRAYRLAPSAAALAGLRAALFAAAGAAPGATLRDALGATADGRLRGALLAAERAAFGPDRARDEAAAELVGAAEGWLR